ncbi:anaerobic ribonucleoside-triphosphate reductase, partial [Bifidobacteriaceae bacterium WP012]
TIKHGVNADAGDPNYDLKQLALECSTKRMYPDVVFYENIVKITGSFKAPMGCRSFLQGWIDPKTGKDVEDGRMNLGVVTVNMPRIALESHGDVTRFWKLFDERMEVAHQALRFRIMRCKQATPVNAPTLFRYGAFGRLEANESVDQLFRNERATVSLGYIGLYETTAVFFGKDWMKDHSWNEDGKQFALSLVRRMNKLCQQWSKAEGYHYSVYSTPAESLTDRFNRMDRQKFGRIEGVTDHDFYTNSFHYPVWLQPTPMEKLSYEVDFPYLASGGFINYCEFPCLQANPKALEAVWDYAYKIGIGYLGTNTPIDHCFVCGFQGDFEPTKEGFRCPECGNSDPDKCNVTKRTCGYLGNPVQRPMVHGRHEEIAHRVKHMSGETGHVTLDNGESREWYEEAK